MDSSQLDGPFKRFVMTTATEPWTVASSKLIVTYTMGNITVDTVMTEAVALDEATTPDVATTSDVATIDIITREQVFDRFNTLNEVHSAVNEWIQQHIGQIPGVRFLCHTPELMVDSSVSTPRFNVILQSRDMVSIGTHLFDVLRLM